MSKQTYSTGTVLTYQYDPVGNVTSYGGTSASAYQYDALDRLTRVATTKAAVTTTTAYIYDEVGNRISRTQGSRGPTGATQNIRYEYDKFDRPVRVASGTMVTTYAYDGEGRRLFRKLLDRSDVTKADTIYYQYGLGQVIAERDGTGAPINLLTRGLGGELISTQQAKDGTLVFIKRSPGQRPARARHNGRQEFIRI